ncbi:MAG: hypothetical protein ACKOC5_10255 [Chloroflexota bacterium]
MNIEELWDALLSRDPAQVRQAFAQLEQDEQELVRAHLYKMTSEEGWHPEQVRSAQAALAALAAESGQP